MYKFAVVGVDGFCWSVIETFDNGISDSDVDAVGGVNSYIQISASDNVIGHKYVDGVWVAPVNSSLPVWPVDKFVMILGADVLEVFNTTTDKDLNFMRFLLERVSVVDLNNPDYFKMVNDIYAAGVISSAQHSKLMGA